MSTICIILEKIDDGRKEKNHHKLNNVLWVQILCCFYELRYAPKKSAIIFIHIVVNIFDWHKYFFNPFLANVPILYLLKSFSWCEFKLYIIVLLTGIPLKIVFLETYCSTKLFWDINSQNSHLMLRDEERVFKKARCFYLKTSLSMRAF